MIHGFVYVMENVSMPGLLKIGCTERAPAARARELSSPGSVPTPFNILCFAEFEAFQRVEMEVHERLGDFRVSASREFFRGDCLARAVALLWWHPARITFTDATADRCVPSASHLMQRLNLAESGGFVGELANPHHSLADTGVTPLRKSPWGGAGYRKVRVE